MSSLNTWTVIFFGKYKSANTTITMPKNLKNIFFVKKLMVLYART